MTLGGWNFRGLARFAGVRSGELQCRARRRQTSVRATRLRFYATLCLYPCLLTGLTLSLYSSSSATSSPVCSGLRRTVPPVRHPTFPLFLTSISPTFISSTRPPGSLQLLQDVFNNARACSALANARGYLSNRTSRVGIWGLTWGLIFKKRVQCSKLVGKLYNFSL